jgi:hypothetical protein
MDEVQPYKSSQRLVSSNPVQILNAKHLHTVEFYLFIKFKMGLAHNKSNSSQPNALHTTLPRPSAHVEFKIEFQILH